jgi:hypothetical protein
MGLEILDGTGKGFRAKVNAENQLETLAVAIPEDKHTNSEHQGVWSLPFEGIDPVGADDYFFYISNTGTKNISITDIRINSTVIGTVEIQHVSGTPVFTAGTDVTPVNRFLGSSKALFATVKTATDTTGLVEEGILFFMDLSTADELFHLRTTSNIIIPPGQAVALLWGEATGALTGIVSAVELQEL